jgi:cytochrome c
VLESQFNRLKKEACTMVFEVLRRPINFSAAVARCSVVAIGLIGGVGLSIAGEANKGLPGPDAENGKQLAEKLCISCHVISEGAETSVPAGVPSFRGIANKPGQTGDHVRSKLINPHPPMPDISLSRQEIEDIIAYLDELRDEAAGAPLLPPQPEKSTLPDYPEET